jgi:predicted RNA methylase
MSTSVSLMSLLRSLVLDLDLGNGQLSLTTNSLNASSLNTTTNNKSN